jgi:hypothetical protein
MSQSYLIPRHGNLGWDKLRHRVPVGAYREARSGKLRQRLTAMSQSTMTALQVGLLCDMARQAATGQASAAREDGDCDMEGYSATRAGSYAARSLPVRDISKPSSLWRYLKTPPERSSRMGADGPEPCGHSLAKSDVGFPQCLIQGRDRDGKGDSGYCDRSGGPITAPHSPATASSPEGTFAEPRASALGTGPITFEKTPRGVTRAPAGGSLSRGGTRAPERPCIR